ncbi:hypothetical protein K470DRAFT_261472 [Piedraia hortae CBS 480.64]|uniref:Major facilitator superfamily transporter n=1 Tax=Piedraia hortae CBS 480.64 TaxID=1314780 RepID=A0A6A7C9M5_9PEZI|nr:hypothetical protein K470DRAFT_261472 [Piedraia hortae CBS 480.64]
MQAKAFLCDGDVAPSFTRSSTSRATSQSMGSSTRYRTLSGALVDMETRRKSNILDYADTEAQTPIKPTFAYHIPRRRFTRLFTLSLTATIVLFILYLVHASSTNDAKVRLSLNKPPPPAAWEQFPFLKRFHGGIRTLVDREDNKPEFPAENAAEAIKLLPTVHPTRSQEKRQAAEANAQGTTTTETHSNAFLGKSQRFDPYGHWPTSDYEPRVKCYLDNRTRLDVPQLLAYRGVVRGFPDPAMGSYKELGLRDDVCFERYGRLGPYGLGYSRKFGGSGAAMDAENEGYMAVWGGSEENQVPWSGIEWDKAQKECHEANNHRFKHESSPKQAESREKTEKGPSGLKLLPKKAVVIRTWHDYDYDAEDLMYLRALVNELSLQSGGEYNVHFLIHVKNDSLPIWSDDEVHSRVLREALPEEFRGMGTLWSEAQMAYVYTGLPDSSYRGLPVYGAYRSTFLPMQLFAHNHPEYKFFWHWEMDARYTGHYYHLFHQVSEWAKQQPRKGLWERNGRFYIPSEHGSWDDFRHMVRVQTEHGTGSKQNMYGKLGADAGIRHPLDEQSRRPEQPVWGPLPPSTNEMVKSGDEPEPPVSYDKDNYDWGVGEEADLITFNPLFDPDSTNWILAEDVTGYNTSDGLPPRRTAIITASRLSRRLLQTMHRETSVGHHTMFSEMWPGSCALHHGYKAVYAPHPVYIDRAWPTSYMAAIFNNGRNGAAGGARTSVFSDERQHNFLGTTWYYHAGHAPNLWRRWLGFRVDNDGGEEYEKTNEGRMCLPAMLLHPVKQVDLIFEHEG